MRELPTTAPHEGLWVLYALRAAFAGTDSSSMPLAPVSTQGFGNRQQPSCTSASDGRA